MRDSQRTDPLHPQAPLPAGNMTTSGTLGPMTVISMEGEAKSGAENALRWVWRLAIALLAGVLAILAWLVAFGRVLDPGSSLGYNLGLAGGLLMLSLFLYPLRKRIRALEQVGSMQLWFRYHMLAGICGPLLVLFHSTFTVKSMNGGVALYAMLLVACSGIVGRFLYRHIHSGLYGRQLSLADARTGLEEATARLGTVFALQTDIQPRLKAFSEAAFCRLDNIALRLWRFITLRWKGRHLAKAIRSDAKRALSRLGREERLPRRELIINYRLARAQIDAYIEAVVLTSQLAVWERLFSLWHIIHIPFIYLLVLSGIIHVVAVHMY